MRGPLDLHPVITVSLDGVPMDYENLKEAVACVQDFVRHLLFTQRNFFSETGISMLSTAIAAANAVGTVLSLEVIRIEAVPEIAYLKSCWEKFVSRKKAVKEHGSDGLVQKTVASSVVAEASPRTSVRISDIVELGDVQDVEEHNRLGLPCCSRSVSSPRETEKRPQRVSLVAAKKKHFSIESPSASRPSIEAVSKKNFEKLGARRSGRDRRNAPVSHGGYQEHFNCIYVESSRI